MLKQRLIVQNFITKKSKKRHQSKIFETHYKISLISTIVSFFFKAIVLVLFGLFVVLPFYFMFNLALQSNEEATGGQFVWAPVVAKWSNFISALDQGYWRALLITFGVTTISVVTRSFFAMTLGYAFSLKRWRFKNLMWWFFLSLLMLPEVALLLGQFRVVVALGWSSGVWIFVAMFIPFVSSTFSAFMFRNAFMTIPDRTKEAAMIDGVGPISFFFKVAIPMVKSTTLTVLILTAFAAWNSFTWPQLLLTGASDGNNQLNVLSTWLFQVGLDTRDPDSSIIFPNIRMAGAIMTILPMIIIYFIFRRKIMRAISKQGSAIKG